MRSVYLCFLLVPVVLASTDILVTPQGPVVGWTDSENNAYLLNPSTHSVPEQIGQVYDRLQLSFCEDADTEPVILVAFGSWFYWYAQVNTYSASNFSLITQQELSHEDFAPPEYCTVLALPVLPRYINSSEQRIALIDLQTGCTDVQDHRYLTVCSVDPWSSCLISPVDTSNWIETSTHSSRFTSLMARGNCRNPTPKIGCRTISSRPAIVRAIRGFPDTSVCPAYSPRPKVFSTRYQNGPETK